MGIAVFLGALFSYSIMFAKAPAFTLKASAVFGVLLFALYVLVYLALDDHMRIFG